MTDDLVKRLLIAADRADTVFDPDFASPWREAAACIKAQAKRNKELEAALREIKAMTPDPEFGTLPIDAAIKVACAALGEKKDGVV